jgi:hypothetical protein
MHPTSDTKRVESTSRTLERLLNGYAIQCIGAEHFDVSNERRTGGQGRPPPAAVQCTVTACETISFSIAATFSKGCGCWAVRNESWSARCLAIWAPSVGIPCPAARLGPRAGRQPRGNSVLGKPVADVVKHGLRRARVCGIESCAVDNHVVTPLSRWLSSVCDTASASACTTRTCLLPRCDMLAERMAAIRVRCAVLLGLAAVPYAVRSADGSGSLATLPDLAPLRKRFKVQLRAAPSW